MKKGNGSGPVEMIAFTKVRSPQSFGHAHPPYALFDASQTSTRGPPPHPLNSTTSQDSTRRKLMAFEQ